ncbi:MAG: carbon starvation protein A [Verrucomicrobia bacterium]|nr:carbon starvation protein A [Verrucomicrobiota bacterium]
MRSFPRGWAKVLWGLVALAGAGSLGVVAWQRGEPVNALWLLVATGCVYAIGYRFHSAWLMATVLSVDSRRKTPAELQADGKDFVKTNRWVVFGHHFAAIAGPGPLVGPVLAAQFGYLPGLLWILIGAVLGGAVHDSIILWLSVRRRGKSVGQMLREEVGPVAGTIAVIGLLGILTMLMAVLALVVVRALAESPWGLFTILLTMPLALAMGLGMRGAGGTRTAWVTVLGVLSLIGCVWAGKWASETPAWATMFTWDGKSLAWSIMGYGLAASTLPVWLLLAPRDYLSSFLKIGTVAALGVVVALLAPQLQMPALTKFIDGSGPVFAGPVFPFCFITIACGAVSGFHCLVSSGTTPKLLASEADIRVVGYGAMITEMCVGVLALVAACSMPPGEYFAINLRGEPAAVVQKITAMGFPVTEKQMEDLARSVGESSMVGRTGGAPTFAVGMAQIFARSAGSADGSAMALWYHFAIMFEALFILTTIDAGTRIGRFLVQEVLGWLWRPLGEVRSTAGNFLGSGLFVAGWGWFLYQGVLDPQGGINSLWPIFGVANQLLAVMALGLATTVLVKMGKERLAWVTLGPLVWLVVVTFRAGWMKILSTDPRLGFLTAMRQASAAGQDRLAMTNAINAGITAFFLLLVVLVLWACGRVCWLKWRGRKIPPVTEEVWAAAG